MSAIAASPMEGTAPLLRGQRAAVRDCATRRGGRAGIAQVPAVGPRGAGQGAGAASSGGVQKSFSVRHVGGCAGSDASRAGTCNVCELPWKCHFRARLPQLLVLQSGCGAVK
jgi:hypothetical protein